MSKVFAKRIKIRGEQYLDIRFTIAPDGSLINFCMQIKGSNGFDPPLHLTLSELQQLYSIAKQGPSLMTEVAFDQLKVNWIRNHLVITSYRYAPAAVRIPSIQVVYFSSLLGTAVETIEKIQKYCFESRHCTINE